MIKSIKAVFKPTKSKIIITILFFVGINFLANLLSPFLNSLFLFPSFDCLCGQLQNYFDVNYLNSIPERIKIKSSPETILEASDSWIPVLFFCILPLRIIYYYIFICLIIFITTKIKREKK